MQRRRRAVRVDEICRYLFPMLFILFNAWYWYYYREGGLTTEMGYEVGPQVA